MNERKTVLTQACGNVTEHVNLKRQAQTEQDMNRLNILREKAVAELDELDVGVHKIIDTNRGGYTGKHGFIGEQTQVHFGNERAIMEGKKPPYRLVDDNGKVDYWKGKTPIQQKAVNSDGVLGLKHIVAHADRYPEFVIEDGGKYQIPRDLFRKYARLWNMPQLEAGKLPKEDWRLWKRLQEIHAQHPDYPIEPMLVDYKDIQVGNIDKTISRERARVEKLHQERERSILEAGKPSLTECNKIAAGSAAMEAVLDGVAAIVEHMRDGSKPWEFEKAEWKDVGIRAATGAVKGYARGTGLYVLTNAAHVSALAASAVVTVSFSTAEAVKRCYQGEIDKTECMATIAESGLDAAACAGFAKMGQRIIPVPIVGPLVGSIVGMAAYGYAKREIKAHLQSKQRHALASA